MVCLFRVFAFVVFSILLLGCDAGKKPPPTVEAPIGQFTGTWATDGTGAGGVRTFLQTGNRMTGHFDQKKGRYDGTINGRALMGRFWWNDDTAQETDFDKTPTGQRGEFEITLSLDGNSFTGRSRYEGGTWVSWNGIRTNTRLDSGEKALPSFQGTWATDGMGAGGVRTFLQNENSMTGHFDGKKGRYTGTADGMTLDGRFWWNDDPTEEMTFDKTPTGQRGEFEITLSLDGNSFTGRSRFEGGTWVSWNGIRTSSATGPDAARKALPSFSGTWATDGTGARGVRTFLQHEKGMTGHFDEKRGRYTGTVDEMTLAGRFWWNDDPAEKTDFDKTPIGQRGEFEITLSLDGNSFTGRSRYEGGEWVSWNGIRTSLKDPPGGK
jgi:hypothetical protein